MALLVGLTGGMGSGKTTVANLFKALGAHIIDADEISRSLVEPGQPAWQEIVDRLGTQVIREDQSLDRKKIADLVFENPEECKILENILHPRVFEREQIVYREIREKDPHALVIIDAALLIESQNYRKVDKVIVVACDEEIQIRRVLARNKFSRSDIERRLRQQMPLSEKVQFADYVIQNNSDLAELSRQVQALCRELRKLAG